MKKKESTNINGSPASGVLPRVTQLDTMLGWRKARLLINKFGGATPGLYSLNATKPGGIKLFPEMEAVCVFEMAERVALYNAMRDRDGHHTFPRQHRKSDIPALGCHCGFYALKTLEALDILNPLPYGNVTLEVEFSGTIIEATNGFRAQHQRILSCHIPKRCWGVAGRSCHNTASACGVGHRVDDEWYTLPYSWAKPLCDGHHEGVVFTPAQIAGYLGVEVVWDE